MKPSDKILLMCPSFSEAPSEMTQEDLKIMWRTVEGIIRYLDMQEESKNTFSNIGNE